jgi:hypothetical protein
MARSRKGWGYYTSHDRGYPMKAFAICLVLVLLLAAAFNAHLSAEGMIPVAAAKSSDALFPVSVNDKHGFMNKEGMLVIPLKFDGGERRFSEGLAPVGIRKKHDYIEWGFIDTKGRFIIPPEFFIAYSFSEGRALVARLVKNAYVWSYIDKTGKMAFPLKYEVYTDSVPEEEAQGSFSDGRAGVQVPHRGFGYIDRKGKLVISNPKFDLLTRFSEGLAAVRTNDYKWSYIDRSGKVAIRPKGGGPFRFHEGLAVAGDSKKWGYMDKTGKIAIKLQFEEASDFSEGLAFVHVHEKQAGFINKKGRLVIKGKLIDGQPFSEGLAAVSMPVRDKYMYGFVDRKGKIVIKPQFASISGGFNDGLARVATHDDGSYGYIDKTGKYVWKPTN